MSSIDTLAHYFSQFPGIGRRQARRFVYFLLDSDPNFIKELSDKINSVKDDLLQCDQCFCFFEKIDQEKILCSHCRDINNDSAILMIVEKDVDLENIRKSDVYNGLFFVLGGLIPLLENKKTSHVRLRELTKEIERRMNGYGLKEIIIALNANPEGEHTTHHLTVLIEPLSKKHPVKITTLGRGLSTGTELEYSDDETIKHAFLSRR